MILYLTPMDATTLKKKIQAKEVEMVRLGHNLGDAMSRTGSFPASSPEYAAVHLEMKNLQNNIDTLKSVLNKYTVLAEEKVNKNIINNYSLVVLENEYDERISYYISLAELKKEIADDCSLATPESPVGKTIIGHKLGDIIEIILPGTTKKYKIVEHTKKY